MFSPFQYSLPFPFPSTTGSDFPVLSEKYNFFPLVGQKPRVFFFIVPSGPPPLYSCSFLAHTPLLCAFFRWPFHSPFKLSTFLSVMFWFFLWAYRLIFFFPPQDVLRWCTAYYLPFFFFPLPIVFSGKCPLPPKILKKSPSHLVRMKPTFELSLPFSPPVLLEGFFPFYSSRFPFPLRLGCVPWTRFHRNPNWRARCKRFLYPLFSFFDVVCDDDEYHGLAPLPLSPFYPRFPPWEHGLQ